MVRLASGLVLIVVFFALIWFAPTTVLLAVALAVGALAVHEYVQLFRPLGAHVPAVPTMLATWAMTAMIPFPHVAVDATMALAVIVIAIWVIVSFRPGATALTQAALGAAAASLAPVYIGVGLGSLVAIHLHGGRGAVLLLMATIVVSDSAQYYTGRTLGRHTLAPTLSPKKTIEGALGGCALAPLFLVLAAPWLLNQAPARGPLALFGLGLVVVGIAGDLFKSLLKRAAGVKDSSALIPGHGGVLDRIDALLFASPVFYLYVRTLLA